MVPSVPMRFPCHCLVLLLANASGANLTNAQLNNANLLKTKFYGADLSHAKLDNAHLLGTDFARANLQGICIKGALFDKIRICLHKN